MSFSLFNRVLLRGMFAGAVVFTGTACSRADRSESGQDSSAAVLPDTSAQSNTPRAETAPAGDKDAAGYHPMERDTTNPVQNSDSARATADRADTAAIDTAAAGYTAMARDTTTVADQVDTAAALEATTDTASQAEADVSAETDLAVAGAADTTGNAGSILPPEDSTEILGQVTTDSTPEAGSPDSAEVVRIRPPEDSTEMLGADEAADETADELVVRPEDRETVAASEPTDEVGAAAIGGNVTGAEAVALVSREGVRCAVVDPEENEVRWDMSSTPAALNPCGMGSMVLSRIWTAGQGDSGTAGQ